MGRRHRARRIDQRRDLRAVGAGGKCLVVIGEGLVVVALGGEQIAAREQGHDVVGIEPECSVEIGGGAREVALLPAQQSPLQQKRGDPGRQADRLVEVMARMNGIVLGFVDLAGSRKIQGCLGSSAAALL